MRAAGEANTKRDATRLRLKCQQLIIQAESLKNNLNNRPSVSIPPILRQTSRLHGNHFPPWVADPTTVDFQLVPGQEPFT